VKRCVSLTSLPFPSLSSTRRAKLKRKPEGYPQAADIGRFAQSKLTASLHSTRLPGVSALDVTPDGTTLLTGGRDKQVQVFNNITDKLITALKGHTKEINQVAFAVPTLGLEFGAPSSESGKVPSFAVSASSDSSVRIWKSNEAGVFSLGHTINDFKGAVTGVCVHPSADFFAAVSKDGSWGVFDLSTGSRLLHNTTSEEWTSLDIHPDGILVALGSASGAIKIIDIRTGQDSATLESESSSPAITSLSFSENGYYLASATAALIEVWDLRKLNKAGSVPIEGDGKTPTVVRFDPSAQFLAVAGADVRIYANKTWQLLWTDDSSNTAEVSNVKWNWSSGSLITASLDRTVRTFSAAGEPVTVEAAE
jgi:pre-mRNA-processing factor 19